MCAGIADPGCASRIYVDSRITAMFEMNFKKSFFDLGDFPSTVFNGSQEISLTNPWADGTNAAPFDQGRPPRST